MNWRNDPPWWTDARLRCPPEVAEEFVARAAHEKATPGVHFPISKAARIIEARHRDLQNDANEKARNTPTHFKSIRIDPKEQEERFIESEFERMLQREAARR